MENYVIYIVTLIMTFIQIINKVMYNFYCCCLLFARTSGMPDGWTSAGTITSRLGRTTATWITSAPSSRHSGWDGDG